jgi:ParB family chromosome partitioning protein
MKYIEIDIDELRPDPENVRKTGDVALGELKASLLAHGLLQNLVVKEVEGKPVVIAGNRRLLALQALREEGKLPDALRCLPCQLVEPGMAVETALAENTQRVAMHPADEFEAFHRLSQQGRSAEEIARRFGCSEKKVLQRLKLARVHPELLQAYRDEEITLAVLEAFTITDDTDRQLQVWKAMDGWQRTRVYSVRKALSEQMVEAHDKRVKFITLAAYETAGGTLRQDLFGEDVWLEDAALLQKLVAQKLEAEKERLLRQGWGWVEADIDRMPWEDFFELGRLHPEETQETARIDIRLKALEEEEEENDAAWDAACDKDDEAAQEKVREAFKDIERRRDGLLAERDRSVFFDPDKKKQAGCHIFIGPTGKLECEQGLLLPQDTPDTARPDETTEAAPGGYSDALRDSLAQQRLAVMQLALAQDYQVAADLMGFTLFRKALASLLDWRLPDIEPGKHFSRVETTAAASFQKLVEGVSAPDWFDEDDAPVVQFQKYRNLGSAEKAKLLACCVAMTLRPALCNGDSAVEWAFLVTGEKIYDYWRPTAENFLKKLNRAQLLELGEELLGDDWLSDHRADKKGELVKGLEEVFASPDEAASDAVTAERIRHWLPEGMGFAEVQALQENREAA